MRRSLLILPAAAAAVAIAGCGGVSYGGSGGAAAKVATTSSTHAVVGTRHGKLGTFLVDGRGRTLYVFMKDTGRTSQCNGTCATDWPPLISKRKPVATGSAKATALSTSRRRDGHLQVDYHGHPVYRFTLDTAAGQTRGEGIDEFGGHWYVASPAGTAIKAAPASTTMSSGSGSGSGSSSGSSVPGY